MDKTINNKTFELFFDRSSEPGWVLITRTENEDGSTDAEHDLLTLAGDDLPEDASLDDLSQPLTAALRREITADMLELKSDGSYSVGL